MAKKHPADERTRLLRSLRRRQFDRFRFIGLDALVTRVSDSAPVSAAVEAKNDECLKSRLYPVQGGHLVKWPHDGTEVPSEDFWIEPGGWDHEHCHGCNRTIHAGGTAWLTVRGSFYLLCPYCYRRVVQLRDRGQRQG